MKMCVIILYNYCNHTTLYGTITDHGGTRHRYSSSFFFASPLNLSPQRCLTSHPSHLSPLNSEKITRFYKISQKERQRERGRAAESRINSQRISAKRHPKTKQRAKQPFRSVQRKNAIPKLQIIKKLQSFRTL